MKKISTGMRVDIEDIRRGIDELMQDHHDGGLAGEQMFVEELMDTTPSSSYDEQTWRDGYIYDARDSALAVSPGARAYASDDDSADAVVTHTAVEGNAADLFVVEEVPGIDAINSKGSLLTGALAAVKAGELATVDEGTVDGDGGGGGGGGGGTLNAGDKAGGNPGALGLADGTLGGNGMLTARQLIVSVLHECQSRGLAVGSSSGGTAAGTQGATSPPQPPERYELRIAADDWEADLDFPEIDSSAAVTEVGVDQFVLCPHGQATPVMQLRLAVRHGGAHGGGGGAAMDDVDVAFELPNGRELHRMRLAAHTAAAAAAVPGTPVRWPSEGDAPPPRFGRGSDGGGSSGGGGDGGEAGASGGRGFGYG